MPASAVWVLFFLSGVCGLVYEVLWTRQLGLIFGNTVQSLAAVLSTFMAGLALGSWLSGRYLVRGKRLFFVYGLLETFIGFYCLALPWLFGAVQPVYGVLYGETGGPFLSTARFVISFALLLVPTTCMGATLPVLSQYLVRSPESFSRTAGMLYAVNTFGAVLGAVAAGFLLLPELGRSSTNLLAVSGNLLLGAIAMWLGWRTTLGAVATGTPPAAEGGAPPASAAETTAPQVPETAATPPAAEAAASPASVAETAAPQSAATATPAQECSPLSVRAAALAFCVTGFAAMATQIGWTRALSLAIGSSTYAFSLIVALFILGLGLGGAWGARFAPRRADPLRALGGVLLLIGFLTMGVVALLGLSPVLFFGLIARGSQSGFGAVLGLEAAGLAALLLPPTFFMGATLPLTLRVAQARAAEEGGAGRTIGYLYALNTVGAILGSLLGGLVLLPLLQIQNTLHVSSLLYSLPGAALVGLSPTVRSKRGWEVPLTLLVGTLALAWLPAWDPLWMNSGAYLLRNRAAVTAAQEGGWDFPSQADKHLLYYKEGASATVAVYTSGTGLTLTIGGKPDASSTGDMSTQVGLTLIPELLHASAPEEVLVIGMGSGVSAGAALAPEGVRRVDVVEISPEVIEASALFAEWSGLHYEERGGRVTVAEPRVEVLLNDGRNHLALTSRRYDVIASEPSNPWMAGVGNLFTREAFALCRERLKPGGIACQWIHRYGLGEREFRSVLRTFGDVFPHVQLWCVLPGLDYLLIGSDAPLAVPVTRLLARMKEPRVLAQLHKVGFDPPEELLACFMADTPRVAELSQDAPLHTDDNQLLEFAAPRALYSSGVTTSDQPWRVSPERMLDWNGVPPALQRDLTRRLDLSLAGRWCHDCARDLRGCAQELLDAEADLAPGMPWPASAPLEPRPAGLSVLRLASEVFAGRSDAALAEWAPPDNAPRPAQAEFLEARAQVWLARGNLDAAQADLERAASVQPGRWDTLLVRAELCRARGDTDGAVNAAVAAGRSGAPLLECAAPAAAAFIEAGRPKMALEQVLTPLLSRPELANSPDAGRLWGWRALALACATGLDVPAGKPLDLPVANTPKDFQAVLVSPSRKQHEVMIAVDRALTLDERLAPFRFYATEWLMGPHADEVQQALLFMFNARKMLTPRDAAAYLEQGAMELRWADVRERQKQPAWAVENRRRARMRAHAAAVFGPRDPAPRVLLARACRALGDVEWARAAAAEALQLGGPAYVLPEDLRKLARQGP